ncbi:DUF559 domain-containing protein [Sphingomonas sp. MMSM20]|uniref:endonuclease domain-containing protein n=1 Tax=Sphingomonas lycopersici TaxID=2951807 RepID=UPI0022382FAD|nr:DUF559 domain-containing protein [Sphingomonas lycopersici]MCW6532522.1 DUF559 domain-containing protein [Sphingomonas lycopersici]
MPRVPPALTSKACDLRNSATAEERALWERLRHARPRFTRQLPVGRYILDLACRTAKVAVEIDGSQHIENAERDAARTVFLEKLGWRVMRFWNSEVRKNPDGVAEAILASLVDPRGPTHPQPLPSREGSKKEGS